MKGFSKGDSLLIVKAIQNESRQFRVKFAPPGGGTGEKACAECVKQLAQFLPVKHVSVDRDKSMTEVDVLPDQVSLGTLAQVLTGEVKATLPSAYKKARFTDEELSTFVRLCLTDSDFPSFVEAVDRQLQQVIRESGTKAGE